MKIMRPVNSKSLFAFITGEMERLRNKEIDNEEANTQANLCQKATNLLKYELERQRTIRDVTGKIEGLREIESKGFDDTTHIKDNFTDY